ncbi:hypothetical protein B0H10DRAFT_1782139, partial [Mycena sp. CBHHK59/15]
FHRVLNMLVNPAFYLKYVKLPPPDQIPPEIRNNPNYFPFFKGCCGAGDVRSGKGQTIVQTDMLRAARWSRASNDDVSAYSLGA